MKNVYIKVAFIAVFAIIAGCNVFLYQANNDTNGMSEQMLENVEALAGGESGTGFNCRWDSSYTVCYPNGSQLGCPCYSHNW